LAIAYDSLQSSPSFLSPSVKECIGRGKLTNCRDHGLKRKAIKQTANKKESLLNGGMGSTHFSSANTFLWKVHLHEPHQGPWLRGTGAFLLNFSVLPQIVG